MGKTPIFNMSRILTQYLSLSAILALTGCGFSSERTPTPSLTSVGSLAAVAASYEPDVSHPGMQALAAGKVTLRKGCVLLKIDELQITILPVFPVNRLDSAHGELRFDGTSLREGVGLELGGGYVNSVHGESIPSACQGWTQKFLVASE